MTCCISYLLVTGHQSLKRIIVSMHTENVVGNAASMTHIHIPGGTGGTHIHLSTSGYRSPVALVCRLMYCLICWCGVSSHVSGESRVLGASFVRRVFSCAGASSHVLGGSHVLLGASLVCWCARGQGVQGCRFTGPRRRGHTDTANISCQEIFAPS